MNASKAFEVHGQNSIIMLDKTSTYISIKEQPLLHYMTICKHYLLLLLESLIETMDYWWKLT